MWKSSASWSTKKRAAGDCDREGAYARFSVLHLATFLQNNQRQSLEDAIEELEKIEKKADEAGVGTVVYISMAFGNPYGDEWSVDEIVAAVGLLELQEIRTISRRHGRAGAAGENSGSGFGGDGRVWLP